MSRLTGFTRRLDHSGSYHLTLLPPTEPVRWLSSRVTQIIDDCKLPRILRLIHCFDHLFLLVSNRHVPRFSRVRVGDLHWNVNTSFQQFCEFVPTSLIALRTCKSGVGIGIPESISSTKTDDSWLTSGQGALIQVYRK